MLEDVAPHSAQLCLEILASVLSRDPAPVICPNSNSSYADLAQDGSSCCHNCSPPDFPVHTASVSPDNEYYYITRETAENPLIDITIFNSKRSSLTIIPSNA